nr:hypothetical protein [Kibdelosporangium sp. MJ126-NF4]
MTSIGVSYSTKSGVVQTSRSVFSIMCTPRIGDEPAWVVVGRIRVEHFERRS